MHDTFESLQKRCKSYHQKRILKSIGFSALGAMVLGGTLWLVLASSSAPEPSSSLHVVVAPKAPEAADDVHTPKQSKPHATSSSVAPMTMASSSAMRKDVAYELKVDEDYLSNYRAKKTPQALVSDTLTPKTVPLKPAAVTPKTDKTPLHVNNDESAKTVRMNTKRMDTLDSMLTQYTREPKYDLALKIAQFQYDIGDYPKASLWAKKANMIDKESDAAWIMYAKSEYARGNKRRAKEILQLYLANKRSQAAEVLLMTWREEE
jgi:hypothetical protein